ncbi:hypothetical protein GCM10011489_27060 [Gordonia jinhuaensis]|uniref:AB hydrolase-1 domain-containing protein n=1 Tax=Gordonia jinhuaensis TaxID=1517702 RepID=A0A916TAM7_9ACTN|nr:hypothetical protein GCM10011489_27060 [Gordonia jinhuaensis]
MRSAVLVLHGGKPDSHDPSRPWHLSRVRMLPFTWALRRALPESQVIAVHYRVRGWNGDEASPVVDTRAVIARVRQRHGDIPIALVGHSMGGRVAAAVADDPSVTTIVALAPWWQRTRHTSIDEPADTDNIRPDQHVLVVHGSADTWTSPIFSREVTERLVTRGTDAEYISIPGGGHFMLDHPRRWVELTVAYVRAHVGPTGKRDVWRNSVQGNETAIAATEPVRTETATTGTAAMTARLGDQMRRVRGRLS